MAKMYLGNQPVRIIERSKNQLIPYPYQYMYPNGYVKNGITWRIYPDGSVTANGTATGVSSFMLFAYRNDILKPNTTYTLSGSPVKRNELNVMVYISVTKDGAYVREHYDTGNGVTFTTEEGHVYGLTLWIGAGVTIKNLTFYPMLNKDKTKKPFEPYNRYFRIKTGFRVRNPMNLIPLPYDIETIEQDGITFTVGKGGEITLNGTATKNSFFYIKRELNIPKGTYTFSGNSKPSADYAYYLYNPNEDKYYHQYSNNPTTFTLNEERRLLLMIRANANITLDNVTIYPMLFDGETTKPYLIID